MKSLLCASILISLTAGTAFARGEDTKLPPCPAPAAGMAIDEVGMPVDKKNKKGKGIVTSAGGAGAQTLAYNVKSPRDSASGQASGKRAAGKSWGDPHEIKAGTAPARDIKVSASQNGQTLRHAINTKGTGMAGRGETAASTGDAPAPEAETVHLYLKANGERAACTPAKQDQSHDVHELEK